VLPFPLHTFYHVLHVAVVSTTCSSLKYNMSATSDGSYHTNARTTMTIVEGRRTVLLASESSVRLRLKHKRQQSITCKPKCCLKQDSTFDGKRRSMLHASERGVGHKPKQL
jgi:cytoskeletal protein CcmA (bactofilin family)